MAAAQTCSVSIMVVICSMILSSPGGALCPCAVAKASTVMGKGTIGRWATQEGQGPQLESCSQMLHWVVLDKAAKLPFSPPAP